MKALRQKHSSPEVKRVPLWPGLGKAQERQAALPLPKIAFHVQNGVEFVDPLTVTHLEAQSNYTTIYFTSGRRLLISRTLKACMSVFPQNFLRIHQSYLVNPQYVQTYLRHENELRLDSGLQLPVSRSGKVVMQEFVKKSC